MIHLEKLLEGYRSTAHHTRDLGDKFERLIKRFLKVDSIYKERFSNVWLWKDFPERNGKQDVGIDIIAQEYLGGGYCVVQDKCYIEEHGINKKGIDIAYTTLGKQSITHRLIVSTIEKYTKLVEQVVDNQQIQVSRIVFSKLEKSIIKWKGLSFEKTKKVLIVLKKSFLKHQKKALHAGIKDYTTLDKDKIFFSFSAGTIFIFLTIIERITSQHKSLVHFLSLLPRILTDWNKESHRSIRSFATYSDTISSSESKGVR